MRDDSESAVRIPDDLDAEKLAEIAIGLLSLTLHDGRVWKALDWELMRRLHEKGWISDPVSKAQSVILTSDGERVAAQSLRKHFAKTGE